MRLALFGGTFDPVHDAHLAIARAAAAALSLDRVLFVPAARPPHKHGSTHAPYSDRLRMIELAIAREPGFEASRLEEFTSRSYSIDTIERVRAGLSAEDRLYFLIGADAFAEIRTWRRWQDVVRSVEFIVVSRPGAQYEIPHGAVAHRIDTLSMPVSSSAIRKAIAAGERPAELDRAVCDYIHRHNLYRFSSAHR